MLCDSIELPSKDTLPLPYLLATLVNKNGDVVVGNHAFRVNYTQGQILVLDLSANSNIDFNRNDVTYYGYNDDVFEHLGEQPPASMTMASHCTENGPGERQDDRNGRIYCIEPDPLCNFMMGGTVVYRKRGIYFDLYCVVTQNSKQLGKLSIDIEPKYYKPRCKTAQGPQNIYDWKGVLKNGQYPNSGFTLMYRSYQGSTSLYSFRFRTRFKSYDSKWGTRYTDWYEIREIY